MLRVWAVSHHPLSVHTKPYGNTRLWNFLVDLGSNRQCLTLERCMVMQMNTVQCYGRMHPSSLSATFWSNDLGATNETIFGTRG